MDQANADAQAAALSAMDATDIEPVEQYLLQLLKTGDKAQSNANLRTMYRAINDARSRMVFFGVPYTQPVLRKLSYVIKARYALLALAALSTITALFGVAGMSWPVPVGCLFGWYLLNGPQTWLNLRLGAVLLYMSILQVEDDVLVFPAGDA